MLCRLGYNKNQVIIISNRYRQADTRHCHIKDPSGMVWSISHYSCSTSLAASLGGDKPLHFRWNRRVNASVFSQITAWSWILCCCDQEASIKTPGFKWKLFDKVWRHIHVDVPMILEQAFLLLCLACGYGELLAQPPSLTSLHRNQTFVSSVIECYFNLCKNTCMQIIL